jgi:predicted glycoside hydrolase/deacetylase ChbG (UPF0249 family)
MSKVIMSADDYGMSESVDAGIINLIQHGRITATACMVLSPRWEQAAKKITTDIRKKAAIGLHLDMTEFGEPYALKKLIKLSLLRQLPYQKIKTSIHQQLDRFESALKSRPDYVDGHQHVHQLPQIRDTLLEVLTERYKNDLPWLRIAKPPFSSGIKGIVIRMLGASTLKRKALALNFKCSSYLLGVYGFEGSPSDYEAKLEQWLAEANSTSGTVAIMCHPALQKYSLDDHQDPIFESRLTEYQVLNSEIVGHFLDQVELVQQPH